jgi:hypothetical protein
MSEAVRSAFNNISTDYDAKRRKFILCYDFYNIGNSILHAVKIHFLTGTVTACVEI